MDLFHGLANHGTMAATDAHRTDLMNVRRAWRWCCIALGLAGVCGGLHLYGEHRLVQARATLARAMLLPAQPAACGLPESDPRNAARWYQAAGSAYMAYMKDREPPDLRPFPLLNRSPATWSAKELEQTAADLAGLDRTLALAHEAGSLPVCELRVVPSDRVDTREEVLARPLLLEAGFRLRQHRLAEAVRAVRILGDLAFGLERQRSPLSQMIGTGLERGYLRGLDWILGAPDMPPGLLRNLQAGLPSESVASVLARYYAGEAVPYAADQRVWRGVDGGLLAFCCRDLKQARSLEDFARIRLWADLPYRQAQRALQAYGRRLDTLARFSWTGFGIPKGESLLSPAGSWVQQILRLKGVAASRQLAALSLGLRIEAATRGAYPERLPAGDATLVDPLVGAHPTYTRTAGGGAHLANPRAAAAYAELGLWLVPPPLEWTLPPPAAAAVSGHDVER